MKTYDEVFQNVIEATNAHHRKVKKIQNAISASVVCAVCVIGASMYLKLEKPETIPPDAQTTTTTTAIITETMDASSTGKFFEDPTELNFTDINTIPVIINTVISGTNQTETQLTAHSNQSQQTTAVATEIENTSPEELTNASINSTSIKYTSAQTTHVTPTEAEPTELTSSETKQTYTTYTTPFGHSSDSATTNKDIEPTESVPADTTGAFEPVPTDTSGAFEPVPTDTTEENPEPTIFTSVTTEALWTITETQETESELTETNPETTTTETTTTEQIMTIGDMIILPQYEEDFISEIEPISVYIDTDVKERQTLTEVIGNSN